jgi:hypothetical protein
MMFAFSDKDWPGIAKMVEECGELTGGLAAGDPDEVAG